MLNPTLTTPRAGSFSARASFPPPRSSSASNRPSSLPLCSSADGLCSGVHVPAVLIIMTRAANIRPAAQSIAGALYMAAGVLTVVALFIGMRTPSDPKATFGAFYVFVFYFACAMWSIESRVAAAELTAKEQMLRLECRLADLAEKLGR